MFTERHTPGIKNFLKNLSYPKVITFSPYTKRYTQHAKLCKPVSASKSFWHGVAIKRRSEIERMVPYETFLC